VGVLAFYKCEVLFFWSSRLELLTGPKDLMYTTRLRWSLRLCAQGCWLRVVMSRGAGAGAPGGSRCWRKSRVLKKFFERLDKTTKVVL